MCFSSQPSPALPYQVSALRQQAAHRWEEEETEKKKYRRLNINIIEGFWEAFLSHVDGIALLNGSQPLCLLRLSASLFAFSALAVSRTPLPPPPPQNKSSFVGNTDHQQCCRCPPRLTGKTGLLRFDLLAGDVVALRPLPFLVCLTTCTHAHTHARNCTHARSCFWRLQPSDGILQQRHFNFPLPPFPPPFLLSLPRSWKRF